MCDCVQLNGVRAQVGRLSDGVVLSELYECLLVDLAPAQDV